MCDPRIDYDEQDDYYDGATLPDEEHYWSWALLPRGRWDTQDLT